MQVEASLERSVGGHHRSCHGVLPVVAYVGNVGRTKYGRYKYLPLGLTGRSTVATLNVKRERLNPRKLSVLPFCPIYGLCQYNGNDDEFIQGALFLS